MCVKSRAFGDPEDEPMKSLFLAAALLIGLSGFVRAADETRAEVSVTFHEWQLPTPGSHPHDPLAEDR